MNCMKNTMENKDLKEELVRELKELQRRVSELEEKALRESELRYRLLFEGARDGMLLLDGDTGRITDVNRSFTEMSGYSNEEVVGKRLWEIGPLRGIDAGLVTFRELKERQHIYYDDLPFETRAKGRIAVEFFCSIHSPGRVKVIHCMVRDISARKSVEEQLWKSEARFRAIFNEAAIGIVVVNDEGRTVECNRRIEEMLGYEAGRLTGTLFADIIHPDDRASDAQLYEELSFGKRNSYRAATRFVRKDGTVLWGLLAVSVVRTAQGGPLFTIRMVEDITERKRAEESVIKSRDFYLSLIDELPNPIRRTDVDAKSDYFNKSWLEFTGRRMSQEIGDAWMEGVHPDDVARVRTVLRDSFGSRGPYVTEYRLRRRDGAYRWLAEYGRPFNDINGEFTGYISSCYDIHDRRMLEEKLHSISITDDLTGLLNRRGFFTLAQQQVKVAARAKKGVMLFYADLDGFKKINDTVGHQEGDLALVDTAAILKDIFRESDIVARLGGDEFAVLMLEDTDIRDVNVIVNRLRESLDAYNARSEHDYTLSMSAGIARYDPDRPCSLDELIAKADALMYKEKRKKQQSDP